MKKIQFIFLFLVFAGQANIAKSETLPDIHLCSITGVNLQSENKVKTIDSIKKVYAKTFSPASVLLMEAEIYFHNNFTEKKALSKKDAALKQLASTKSEPAAQFLLMNGLKSLKSNNDTIEYINSCLQYQTVEDIDNKYTKEYKRFAYDAKNDHAFLLLVLSKALYNSGQKEQACKTAQEVSKFSDFGYFRVEADEYCPPPQNEE